VAEMRNLKGWQFQLKSVTAERNAISNVARNIPSPLVASLKKRFEYKIIIELIK